MIIKDKNGNECKLNKKIIHIGNIGVVIGKKYPNGKPSKFWHGYEETTGHWVGIGSTQEECVERIEKAMPHIEATLEKLNIRNGGLFR